MVDENSGDIQRPETNTPHEFGTQPQDLREFGNAVAAVDAHNQQYSLGGSLSRMILNLVEERRTEQNRTEQNRTEQNRIDDTPPNIPLDDEQAMARDILGITNQTTLEKTGLGISPIRTTHTIHTREGTHPVGEVKLRIMDGSTFTGFLHTVEPANVTDNFKDAITKVITGTTNETEEAILSGDTTTAVESLAYADGIVASLNHLGLSNSPSVTRLTELSRRAKEGVAFEYLTADRTGILGDVDSHTFGPSEWQRDSTQDYLNQKWQAVLRAVTLAKSNPSGSQLAEEIVNQAQAHLDFAKSDWQKLKAGQYGGESYGEGFEGVFERVQLELDAIRS